MTGEPFCGLLEQLYTSFLFLCLLFLPVSLLVSLVPVHPDTTKEDKVLKHIQAHYLTVAMICMVSGVYAVVLGMKQ